MPQWIVSTIKCVPYYVLGAVVLFIGGVTTPNIAEAKEIPPIAFSHKIHATDNQVPCQYCHIYARRSSSSGVPPVKICVGCHGTQEMKFVAADKPEADKVREYWAKQEPIPWVKMHDIPDFVRFPHYQHINAESTRFPEGAGSQCDPQTNPRSLDCRVKHFKAGGDERCSACHGDIKSMDMVRVVDPDFGNMGWCLQCHLQVEGVAARKSALSTLGGWFNAKAQEEKREALIHLENPKGYHNPNLTDCLTCHY